MFSRIPSIFKNFYFIVGALFLLWMLLIDSSDLISQYMLSRKLNNYQNQKSYYIEKIQEVKKERELLMNDEELLEKFAREKYLMKKPTEEIFVIVEEQ